MAEDDIPYPRFASRGHAYVYVLPCRDEDLLKVGFSREPFRRFHTLHRRFFEFFDLDRGLLVGVDRLADARRIERHFIAAWADSRAPAPLVVPVAAAGHTEWYRGIHAEVTVCAREIAAKDSHVLHEPLRPWLQSQLRARADRLFDWSARMLELVEYEQFNGPAGGSDRPVRRALLDTLDMYADIGLSLADLLPAPVLDWYRHGDHRAIFG